MHNEESFISFSVRQRNNNAIFHDSIIAYMPKRVLWKFELTFIPYGPIIIFDTGIFP